MDNSLLNFGSGLGWVKMLYMAHIQCNAPVTQKFQNLQRKKETQTDEF